MSNVVPFKSQSPLAPYLGHWYLDPLSVSRNKVVKHTFGSDMQKMLWELDTMEEVTKAINESEDLLVKYRQLLQCHRETIMSITREAIIIKTVETKNTPEETTVLPILGATFEEGKAVIKTTHRGSPCETTLRIKGEWLMATEKMQGFPALTHRYHREPGPQLPLETC